MHMFQFIQDVTEGCLMIFGALWLAAQIIKKAEERDRRKRDVDFYPLKDKQPSGTGEPRPISNTIPEFQNNGPTFPVSDAIRNCCNCKYSALSIHKHPCSICNADGQGKLKCWEP